jgi:hypothetical protein
MQRDIRQENRMNTLTNSERQKMYIIVYCYISEERDALLNENDNWITSDSELI